MIWDGWSRSRNLGMGGMLLQMSVREQWRGDIIRSGGCRLDRGAAIEDGKDRGVIIEVRRRGERHYIRTVEEII